ncbi:hypothetical protein CDAR_218851 [Caerostris darwini]|uniref:Uncharacterized protein n=1 Tax=Caerostris darwini TaxID=1538125 RepID=A0AAV4VPZ0_9ARAC|nr:hypothetical protein CDAR_218851 [Caerostris darwini]
MESPPSKHHFCIEINQKHHPKSKSHHLLTHTQNGEKPESALSFKNLKIPENAFDANKGGGDGGRKEVIEREREIAGKVGGGRKRTTQFSGKPERTGKGGWGRGCFESRSIVQRA